MIEWWIKVWRNAHTTFFFAIYKHATISKMVRQFSNQYTDHIPGSHVMWTVQQKWNLSSSLFNSFVNSHLSVRKVAGISRLKGTLFERATYACILIICDVPSKFKLIYIECEMEYAESLSDGGWRRQMLHLQEGSKVHSSMIW